MGLGPNQMYPGATLPDPEFPRDKFRDNNPPTLNNGSPLKAIKENQDLSLETAIMNDAGFEYDGVPDTPQSSQLFKAHKASLSTGANLLSNHNFIQQRQNHTQPAPSTTPTSYPAGYEIFSGVFANETIGITNLIYDNGRVAFSAGGFYMPVANRDGLEFVSEFVASVADFDGKPRQLPNTSWSLVGGEYRVTVDASVFADGEIGSVKFEQGSTATRHEVVKTPSDITDMLIGFVLPDSLMSASRGFAFLADGSEYNRADYPKLWSKVKGTAMLVSQSLINTNPETYAANYGDGDGSTTFTLPNYGLRPHLAAAGAFGAVGSTVEDQIQNITGTIGSLTGTSSSSIIQYVGGSGAFIADKSGRNVLNQGNDYTFIQDAGVSMSFDASRVVRTGGRTEVNSSFLNFYIIHGESA
ncbi:tail fiber protein [Vibrio phage H188]|nr:tail fiber protein [Vibrio phage H188]